MDQAQVVLKLFLDEVGVAPRIDTVSERKTLQKVVYLGEAAGVDLGYRYNWYHMGPYSPGLTRDYFGLADAADVDGAKGFELQASAKAKLNRIKPLLSVPDDIPLPPADWLELLASIHFLRTRRRLDGAQATEVLNKEKRHVAGYEEKATSALHNVGLL